MNRKSGTSLIWTIVIILGIIFFWRQLLYLTLFLIAVIVCVVAYFYYRGRKLSDARVSENKRRLDEFRKQQQQGAHEEGYQQKSTGPVMDAEFTVKSKEID